MQSPGGLFGSTVRNLLWEYGGTFAQAASQLVVLVILSRLLDARAFGLIGIATVFIAFATIASQFGVGQALVQRRTLDEDTVRNGFTLTVAFGSLMGLALVVSAPAIATFFREPEVTPVLRALAPYFPVLALGSVAEALLQRDLRFRALSMAHVGSYVVGYGGAAIPLALAGAGVWSLVAAVLAQGALRTILLLRLRPHAKRPLLGWSMAGSLLRFGAGLSLSKVFNNIATHGDYIVIGRVLGAGPLGIYTRAYQISVLPANLLGQALNKVLFSVLSRMQDDPKRLANAYLNASAFVALVSGPVAAVVLVSAPELVRVLLGPDWEAAIAPLMALALVLTARTAYKVDDAFAKATGNVYRRVVRDVAYATAVLTGVAFGIRFGLTGAALGVAAAIVLNYVLAVAMSLRITKVPVSAYLATLAPGYAIALLLGASAWGARALLIGAGVPANLFLLVAPALVGAMIVLVAVVAWPPLLGRRMRRILGRVPLPGSVPEWGRRLVKRASLS